ncbi:MAG: hypothetical protein PHU51_02580 [Candidatus Nanoarchaeia archaeon]|nr:hypothetical protein [Candidatus Nanoarchaeia archaeon]
MKIVKTSNRKTNYRKEADTNFTNLSQGLMLLSIFFIWIKKEAMVNWVVSYGISAFSSLIITSWIKIKLDEITKGNLQNKYVQIEYKWLKIYVPLFAVLTFVIENVLF